MADGDDHVFVSNEVFHIDLIFGMADLTAAVVVEAFFDDQELIFDDLQNFIFIGEDRFVVSDAFAQFFQLFDELINSQAAQAFELHIDDSLSLLIGQAEAVVQFFFGFVVGAGTTDDLDDFVDIIHGDLQAFDNVLALFCFAQVVFGPADDDLLLMVDVVAEHLTQREDLRHARAPRPA